MPSLLDLRRRIRSVSNTQKITKAMELVAAAKMRRAQEEVVATRPYADAISRVTADLMSKTPEYLHPYLVERPLHQRTVILITWDWGLCGSLNGNNIRLVVRGNSDMAVPVSFITIGRKGREVIVRLQKDLIADTSGIGDKPKLVDILPAVTVALQLYEQGKTDQVDLVFAHFESAGKQQAVSQRLLPLMPPEKAVSISTDFVYEPEPEVVLDALLPRYAEVQVYQAVLENIASEQAARMVAMRNASDNATDLIADLTLTANKVRQTTITTELMEIVSGAMAIEG